jgi:hypothetical protein
MERGGSPETSVLNQPMLRNNPEDRRIQFNRDGSLRCRNSKLLTISHMIHLRLASAVSLGYPNLALSCAFDCRILELATRTKWHR